MRANSFRTLALASAAVALGALALAPFAVAAPEGHYVEHKISLQASGYGSSDGALPNGGIYAGGRLEGHGWFLHPSQAGYIGLSMQPKDYTAYGLATSKLRLLLTADQGQIVVMGTVTWGGDGMPFPYEVPDYDAEFTGTLSVTDGSGAFEGASGTVHLRGHLDEFGMSWSGDSGYGPMHIDEIEGTISVLVP